ncbi:MAG: HEAT repeat domain-containing protein [Xanthomonadales bacterium]|nr:HEAT repeat domain-containing protein [Xanthomonadales bacterium]MCB1634739.1 HEAT repeat domain-containing protein [Xanthomonadales bacterium]MCB1640213.1 HEAT repeat domain-containing protein [Xanthomonadales bacterium]
MMSRRSLTLIAAGLLAAASLQAREPVSERDQLALVALEGLMAAPAERALPLLQRTLAGSASTEVKQRALFVLSQVEDPAARTLLLQTARSGDAELRVEAIRSIGIGGDEASVGELQSIYRDGDAEIRSAVLQAWLIADRPDEVYQVAQDASDPGADEAISMLGAMGAQAQLRQLASSGRGSTSLVNALAVADDLDGLLAMARGNGQSELRLEAIRAIGIVDGEAAEQALQQLYQEASDDALREAALQGLLVADAEAAVLALYRQSNDPAHKRELLRTLTIMGGDEALEAIDAALRGEL